MKDPALIIGAFTARLCCHLIDPWGFYTLILRSLTNGSQRSAEERRESRESSFERDTQRKRKRNSEGDWLQERVCEVNPPVAKACNMQPGWTMWDLYQKFWQPFGGLLVDMERAGMLVDR